MRLALPSSIALHICAALALLIFASRQIVTQTPSGFAPITVHLVSVPEAKTKEPEPEKKVEKKPATLPIKRNAPEAKVEKPAQQPTAVTKTSAPEQHWQEAKSDNNGPKILYQPMPQIPDDLRREAFATLAMARFHIATDGSATVELLTPSQNPRLNHILLETLKTWKFAPLANQANFDIRVHFAVLSK